jgi:hypothetical protein
MKMGNSKIKYFKSKRAKKRSDIVHILNSNKPLKVIVNLSFEQRAKLEVIQKENHLSMDKIMIEALISYLDMQQLKSLWENGAHK